MNPLYFIMEMISRISFSLQDEISGSQVNPFFDATKYFYDLGLSYSLQNKILLTLLIIFLFFVLNILLKRIFDRHVKDIRRHYYWKRASTYITSIIGVIIVGSVWIQGIQSLATFFGLVSAGVAVALRDLISNMAGWLFIIWRQPFRVGDRIQIGQFQGDVIDVRLFQFNILEIGNWVESDQSTGRIIDIPNGMIFREGVANYTKGFQYIWNEIPVLITFESDWKKAKDILTKIASEKAEHLSPDVQTQLRDAAKRYMIFYHHLTPIVYTDVRDSGVLLTIRYLTRPRQRRGTSEAIWEAILEAFAKERTIDLAYPTTRFYQRHPEKSSPAGGEE